MNSTNPRGMDVLGREKFKIQIVSHPIYIHTIVHTWASSQHARSAGDGDCLSSSTLKLRIHSAQSSLVTRWLLSQARRRLAGFTESLPEVWEHVWEQVWEGVVWCRIDERDSAQTVTGTKGGA